MLHSPALTQEQNVTFSTSSSSLIAAPPLRNVILVQSRALERRVRRYKLEGVKMVDSETGTRNVGICRAGICCRVILPLQAVKLPARMMYLG